MDFYRIKTRTTKTGLEVYPDFKVGRSKDLMVQAKSVYAIWDEGTGLWSTDEYDVRRLVDLDLSNFAREIEENTGVKPSVRYLGDFSSGSWRDFKTFVNHLSDANTPLDDKLTFSNTEVKKEDFVSKRLPYPLIEGDCEAYHELMSVLYAPEEKEKLEWAVGAVMAGEAVKIEKFLVLYGPPGAGKGTFLKVLLKLFQGYTATFDAKGLTSSSNAFSMDVFRKNPLVAVQHDGDLSKIEDNVKLNSIVSHEEMTMNEKFKPSYDTHVRAMLFMGTNKPVKITDAKSGIIRRLIDVHPSGERVTPRRYHTLMSQINMELGAIANHCLQVYRNLGRDYYEGYIPEEMMLQTDIFYNFIEAHYQLFRDQDGITVTQAWELYKTFITESGVEYKLPLYKFRTELANYFDEFHNRTVVDGIQVRSYYSGFKKDRFKLSKQEAKPLALVLDYDESLIDESYAECVAQLATPEEIPKRPWA